MKRIMQANLAVGSVDFISVRGLAERLRVRYVDRDVVRYNDVSMSENVARLIRVQSAIPFLKQELKTLTHKHGGEVSGIRELDELGIELMMELGRPNTVVRVGVRTYLFLDLAEVVMFMREPAGSYGALVFMSDRRRTFTVPKGFSFKKNLGLEYRK